MVVSVCGYGRLKSSSHRRSELSLVLDFLHTNLDFPHTNVD